MAKDVRFDIRAQNKSKTAFNAVKRDLKETKAGILSMNKAMLGIGAAVGGILVLAKGLATVTKAAMIQRNAESKLAAVIRATGGATGKTIDEMKEMALAMQDVTIFGDEMILSGLSILATFKNIRGDAFERTTKAALDMSTVMQQDLKSSMIQLGKALNDPITGLSSLSRVGVTFTEQQKEMIKGLQTSGDLMGAQTIILEELESQFGGAAENLDPFQKAMGQLSNTFGDVLEELGFAITDNEVFIELLKELKIELENLIPVIAELIQDFVEWLGPIDDVMDKIDSFIGTVKKTISVLQTLNKLQKFTGIGAIAEYSKKAVGVGIDIAEKVSGSFATGTGPSGLPADGLFQGHKDEIVLNKSQSDAMRQGGGGGINITIAPMFMTGDAGSMRTAAVELKRELSELNTRQG